MTQRVSVSFGPAQEFEFNVHPDDLVGVDGNTARQWFDAQFVELECDLPSPIGKVLVTGLILSVAHYAGVRRFRDQPDWAQQFARCAAALLGRSVIRVDVAGNTIGF
ncbi:MAG: hypothetical protein U5L03_01180 [Burkholderiaceae bacterium]|nr:hypothetical protein [Burkholderiaceae bacterium]